MKMKLINSVLFFLIFSAFAAAQDKINGDFLFFQFDYKGAIKEYKKELSRKRLKKQQFLNLADSYLQTGDYSSATAVYKGLYEKDSTLDKSYVNKLLFILRKTQDSARLNYFLAKSPSFSTKEVQENSAFNREILEKNLGDISGLHIFNCYANSPQSDFSPAFYKDELLFTSGRQKSKNTGNEYVEEAYLDIYAGTIQPDGDITLPKPFSKIPHTDFHKATPYYAEGLENIIYMLSNEDDNQLLFDEKGINKLAIGLVNQKGKFTYLLRDRNTSFYYPLYEAKTGKLFFAANFESGYGGTDLYYVYTNNGQIMSAPINLGPRINSPANEIAPFIFEGSLYFSSDIFYGLGGMDVYTSTLQENGVYSIPVNLGKGINSTSDDFGFIIRNIASGGMRGYFSSNREEGKGKDDIYGFHIADKPGLKTAVIKGVVLNPTNRKSIENAVVSLLDNKGLLLKETLTDIKGAYSFEIPFITSYQIKAQKKGFGVFSKSFAPDREHQNTNLEIGLSSIQDAIEQKENKTIIKMNKFYFKMGTSVISEDIAIELDKVVQVVKNFPTIRLRIETHTSSKGSGSSNLVISQKRSEAIKKYLLQKGVSSKNIQEAIGLGERQLVNQCKDGVYCLEFLHKQNERTLVSVLNYDELH